MIKEGGGLFTSKDGSACGESVGDNKDKRQTVGTISKQKYGTTKLSVQWPKEENAEQNTLSLSAATLRESRDTMQRSEQEV